MVASVVDIITLAIKNLLAIRMHARLWGVPQAIHTNMFAGYPDMGCSNINVGSLYGTTLDTFPNLVAETMALADLLRSIDDIFQSTNGTHVDFEKSPQVCVALS